MLEYSVPTQSAWPGSVAEGTVCAHVALADRPAVIAAIQQMDRRPGKRIEKNIGKPRKSQ
jgi:hypothetical protein